ncbi:MAG: AAA family ATPase [Methanomicrobiales archaeon]|nr:AAA family ATPase [Methanomicrobiales archaeon]
MKITISGPPGSGTTTLAEHLAHHHGYILISAGELFRQMAREKGLDIAQFGKNAENESAIDALIDARQKDVAAGHENVIIEGRLSGWMIQDADLKIWLTAPPSVRAKRIAQRDGGDEYTARKKTIEREDCESRRYQKYYKININDLSPYHLVIDTELWNPDQLAGIVDLAMGYLKK